MTTDTYQPTGSKVLSYQQDSEGSSELVSRILEQIRELTLSRTPSPTDVRISNRMLTALVADPNVRVSERDRALEIQSEIRRSFPAVLPRLYKTGTEIFSGRKIFQNNKCSVCSDLTNLEDINALLLAGLSYSQIAAWYGLSPAAVGRHRRLHLDKVGEQG